MKAHIFCYKGYIGVKTDLENGKFLNNPKDPTELGCMISVNQTTISTEAFDRFKKGYRRDYKNPIGDIMLTKHPEEIKGKFRYSITIFGSGIHFLGKTPRITKDCFLNALGAMELVPNNVPPEFKQMIDELTADGKELTTEDSIQF